MGVRRSNAHAMLTGEERSSRARLGRLATIAVAALTVSLLTAPTAAAAATPAAPGSVAAQPVGDGVDVVSPATGAQVSTRPPSTTTDAAPEDPTAITLGEGAAAMPPIPDDPTLYARTAASAPTADAESTMDESDYGTVVQVTVTGRLVAPGGAPEGGVGMRALATWGDGYNEDDSLLASTTTHPDGTFTMIVNTARSFVVRAVPSADYVQATLMLDGTLQPGWGQGESRVFAPIDGSIAAVGDLTLTPGVAVSGEITVTGSLAPADAAVSLSSDTSFFDVAIDVATGTTPWTIIVPSDSYRAQLRIAAAGVETFHGGDGYGSATVLVVGSAAVTGVDFDVAMSGITISGTVTDPAGEPVERASISLNPRDWANGTSRWTRSASDGTYTLVNVVPGDYVLAFSQWGPAEFWPGTPDYDEAGVITITANSGTLTGYDGVAHAGVSISGISVNADGTPRESDEIVVSLGGEIVRSAYTLADGSYIAGGLPAGDYVVSMRQLGSSGLEQWFDGKRSPAQADIVSAPTDGMSVTGIDFVAVRGATIDGSVTFEGGAPAEGAQIEVYRAHDLYSAVAVATTDSSGRYVVSGLNGDNYAVKVTAGSSGAVTAWFGATAEDPSPSVIALEDDAEFTADVVTRLGGTIRGMLTPAAAGQGHTIQLERTDEYDYQSMWVWSDSDEPRAWEVSGLEGTWIVSVDGLYWENAADSYAATPIHVTPGEVIDGIDFDMRGEIALTGTIELTDGSTLAWGTATVYRYEPEGWTSWRGSADIRDGAFAFQDLEPGEYRVTADGTTEDGDVIRSVDADVEVVAGEIATVALQSQRGWAIEGRVTDAATGSPASGVYVRASNLGSYASDTTDSTGYYRLTVGSRGDGQVVAGDGSSVYVTGRADVSVAESDMAGVDIIVAAGAQITGYVTAENNGNPLSGIDIEIRDDGGSYITSAYTSPNGSYATSALAPGDYYVSFSNWNGLYVQEWWDAQPSFETATRVTLATDDALGVDASMLLGGVVVGSVVDDEGQPLAGATVGLAELPESGVEGFFAPLITGFGLFRASGGSLLGIEATTDAGGNYVLPPVEPGRYALYVYTPASGTTWYNGKRTLSEADAVTIGAGASTQLSFATRGLEPGEHPRTPAQSITDDFTIQTQPVDVTVAEGESAAFLAEASGLPVPTVQWQAREPGTTEFAPLVGQNATTLSLVADAAASGTQVRAVFTQGAATLVSEVATLTVTAPPTAPAAPGAPMVDAITRTSAQLSWSAPADGGSPITGYIVRLTPAGGAAVTSTLPPTLSFAMNDLASGTDYSVTVSAVNALGESPASAATAFTTASATAPGAPTGVSAVAGDAQATVSWSAPASDGGSALTGFRVTASPGGATTTTGATSAVLTGLTNGTSYTFVVTAINAIGESAPSTPSAAVTPTAPTPPEAVIERLAGGNRFDTSAKISASVFEPGLDIVYLANGLNFPDALSAAAAAGVEGAPVLLTWPTSLPAEVSAELDRLDPAKIVLLGGTGAISDAVENAAKAYAPTVERLAGGNRFDTSAKISASVFESGLDIVYLANGLNFPDALSAAAAAGVEGAPVLLTWPTSLPAEVSAELDRLDPAKIVLLGGTGAISDAVETAAKAYAPTVERLAGGNRFDTSAKISASVFEPGLDIVYLANGLNFPDALSAAAAAGVEGAPVLLTWPTSLPAEVSAELDRLDPAKIVLLGGTGAISDAVRDQVAAIVAP